MPNDEIDPRLLAEERIFEITPYLETMGSGRTRDDRFYRKEFDWEREWRYVDDFTFSCQDLVAVFAPEDRHSELSDRFAGDQPHGAKCPGHYSTRSGGWSASSASWPSEAGWSP